MASTSEKTTGGASTSKNEQPQSEPGSSSLTGLLNHATAPNGEKRPEKSAPVEEPAPKRVRESTEPELELGLPDLGKSIRDATEALLRAAHAHDPGTSVVTHAILDNLQELNSTTRSLETVLDNLFNPVGDDVKKVKSITDLLPKWQVLITQRIDKIAEEHQQLATRFDSGIQQILDTVRPFAAQALQTLQAIQAATAYPPSHQSHGPQTYSGGFPQFSYPGPEPHMAAHLNIGFPGGAHFGNAPIASQPPAAPAPAPGPTLPATTTPTPTVQNPPQSSAPPPPQPVNRASEPIFAAPVPAVPEQPPRLTRQSRPEYAANQKAVVKTNNPRKLLSVLDDLKGELAQGGMNWAVVSKLPVEWRPSGTHGKPIRTWTACFGTPADTQKFLGAAGPHKDPLASLGLTVEPYDPEKIRKKKGTQGVNATRAAQQATENTATIAARAAQELTESREPLGQDGADFVQKFASELARQLTKGKWKADA